MPRMFFRFRDRRPTAAPLPIQPRLAPTESQPRWWKRLKAALGVTPTYNREHEAERRRRQIAKGMLKVS
jgi:hypothetical protein